MAIYATLQSSLQSTVYTLLSDNIDNVTVVDGVPKALLKGTGFPYIIVRTPTPTDEIVTFSTTFRETTPSLDIEIWSEQESVVRTLSDSVREVLLENEATLRGAGAYNPKIISSSITPFAISANKTAHHMVMTLTSQFTGNVTASSNGYIMEGVNGSISFMFGSTKVAEITSAGALNLKGEITVLQDFG